MSREEKSGFSDVENLNTNFDVLIIGSGATGGLAAKELTERGLRVLLLDAGPRLQLTELSRFSDSNPDADCLIARRPIQSRNRVFDERNCHLYVDDLDYPYQAPEEAPFNWIRSRQLGARTLLWHGVCLRMSDLELNGTTDTDIDRHWPISLRDLEPHYDRVERLIGVRGVRDGLPHLPDGQFLSPRKAWDPRVIRLAQQLEKCLPNCRMIRVRGIEHDELSLPAENGYPRSSSVGSTLAAAERTGRLTIRTDSIVTRIDLDRLRHKAMGVSFLDRTDHSCLQAQARVVVLAASTIESIRILLNSAVEGHAQGIANSSGTLGHYLMDHLAGPSLKAIGPIVSTSLTRFFIPRFQNLGKEDPIGFQGGYGLEGVLMPTGPFGRLTLEMLGEVLPRHENIVKLDPDRRDRWGMPIAVIDVRYSNNEFAMARAAAAAMRETAKALGYNVVAQKDTVLPPGTRAHELGGARMGQNSNTSVVNAYNQSWDVPNLFVIDGSCFPTAGYQNPTLTMMALASRASGFISEEISRGNF